MTHHYYLATFAATLLSGAAIAQSQPTATAAPAAPAAEALTLQAGPHLFLDDYLIAKSDGVQRQVASPKRFLPGPIVTGQPEHQNYMAFLTVLHDPAAPKPKRFRMWYNVDIIDDPADGEYQGMMGLLESADGIHWPGPYQRLESLPPDGRLLADASVVDDGPNCANPAERYKIIYYDNSPAKGQGPRVAFSPDGVNWTRHNDGRPLSPANAFYDPGQRVYDLWEAFYDPIRQRYTTIAKYYEWYDWTNAEGRACHFYIRRAFLGFSPDFKNWTFSKATAFAPDEKDSGITQWYGAAGLHRRGDLIIGFLRVLRDDLTAEGAPAAATPSNTHNAAGLGDHKLGADGGGGIGYTGLTWTRDGVTWERDRDNDKFFEPDPKVGSGDHAFAWVGSAVPVGDELYLYYAGFRWGHKLNHSTDRQFGLLKIKRDRYVARKAGAGGGQITTPVVTLAGDKLTINGDASAGEIRVQVCDPSGKPIKGLTFADCQPITTDALDAAVGWKGDTPALRGKPVRLQFALKNASLFAFDLVNQP